MSENLEHNNLLARWLNGEALTEDEQQQISQTQGLEELKKVVQDIDTWQLPKVDVESRLREVQTLRESKAQKTIVRTLTFRPLLRVAAVIIFLVVAYFAVDQVMSPKLILIETGLAEQVTHELPDGSMVTLGPKSRLEYKKRNWEDARNLELIGQGFFNVEKGSTFKVTSILGEVTVLGTQFDMYNAGNKLTVKCFEGSVNVNAEGKSEILKALESVVFRNGIFTKTSLSNSQPGWLSGSSEFINTPLSQVITELQRYYTVEITLSSENRNKDYSGSFDHNDLNLALRSVFAPLEITYTLSAEGKVVFD